MHVAPAPRPSVADVPRTGGARLLLQQLGPLAIVTLAVADVVRSRSFAGPAAEVSFVPMAFDASVAFVLLAATLGLKLFRRAHPAWRMVAWGCCALVTLLALRALVSHAFDAPLSFEPPWLRRLAGSGGQLLSSQTATLLVISTFSFAALLSPFSARQNWRDGGIAAAMAVQLFAVVAAISYTAGNPLASGDGWLKVVPHELVGIVSLNALLLLQARATNRLRQWFFGIDVGAEPEDLPLPPEEKRVLALLAVTGLLALAASVSYLRVQTHRQQAQALEAIQTLSDLKARQVVTWRRDRIADARAMAKLPLLAEAVAGAVDSKSIAAARTGLEPWLTALRANNLFSAVVVLNRDLQPIASAPRSKLVASEAGVMLAALRTATDVIEVAPYVDELGVLHWDLLVPLRAGTESALVGALWLQTSPGHHIISQLEWWPNNYRTGQTVLWLRNGDRLISLGGLKESSTVTAAQSRPFGATRTISQLPANSLPGRFQRGEIPAGEGPDYRGRPILGTTNVIRNSSWLLTSRVDSSEVYATLRRDAWLVAGLVVGLLGTTGAATSWLWRQRQRGLVHERVAAELEQKRLATQLGMVMRHANDIILVADHKKQFVDANQRAVTTYGWTKEELLQMTIPDLRPPGIADSLRGVYEQANTAEGLIFESTHHRKDGTTFPVEVSARRIEIDGRPQLLSIIRDISERKRAEAKLRDSEEKFSKAFQANPSGIALSDLASGRYIEVNESWCRIMRYASPEVIGRTSVELGVWANDDDRNRMSGPLLAGEPVRNIEMQVRTRDGEPKTILLNAELIELNGQRCVLSLCEDITDRKHAEVALRASEERYRLIADNTSDLIWLYDRAADCFTYASPSALPLLGYSPEEFVGRKLFDFVTPAAQATAHRALEEAMNSAGGARTSLHLAVELEQRRKDGSLVPTEVVVSVLLDASGQITHLLGVTRDITERKKARETLEKFNAKLEQQVATRTAELAARNREIEALVDSIPDTVLLCDEHGELIRSHFAQNRVSAFPFAHVSSGEGLSRENPVLLEIARELHTVAWASQEAIMLEFDRTIDGVDYSIEARATPAGENRLLILLRDISARKRGERVAQANLERERQLSEMKSQFVSVASHEFRTPLAAATGSLELLELHSAKLTEAKRLELLGRAQRSLGRLTTIMNDVLQLSRADSGRVKVQRMNIDLVQFVQDLIREVEMGDRQQHTFVFSPSGGGTPVPIDTNLFNHILSNLLGNAVRYSPAGTTIAVTLEIGAAAFSLTVADEGIGIPEAERERIFEPFARGSNVGQISGTGLGLNIVKRYTELMGGRIGLLPTTTGAAFHIELPLA